MTERYEIDGQVILNFRDFVKKSYGKDGFEKMAGELPFDISSVYGGVDYPIEYVNKCMCYIKENYGMEMLYNAGRFSMRNLGMKRYLTLLMPPKKILDKLQESVSKMNNAVSLEIEYNDFGALVTMHGPDWDDMNSMFWKGMLKGALEVTKTEGEVTMEESDVAGIEEVYYSVVWK
ncbi:MAG: hypothetical protein R6U61_07050 [Thermoplasmata archaeon]